MALVTLDSVNLSFSGEKLLADVSFQINRGDRLAFIGRNGSGKTSILQMITGALKPDDGVVSMERGLRIGYLQQVPDLDADATVLDTALSGRRELLDLRRKISDLQEQAEKGDPRLVAALGELQERYERAHGDDLERRASLALRSVGFDPAQFGQSTTLLSGGERSRLMLARILVMDADLLLLDEPTNHLDIGGTEFLESYLAGFNGGALVVTHDRTFLDRFATHVVAIEPDSTVAVYSGGYEHYLQVRAERRVRQDKEFVEQQKYIDRNEEFIRRTHANQKARQAKSRQKALDRVEIIDAPVSEESAMALRFPEVEHSGKGVFQSKDLTLRPGGQMLLEKVSFNVERGERLGIIGPNGCGKTTLLKALAGKIEPERGKVQQGFRALIGYYDQELSNLTTGRTVLEELSARRPELNEQALRDLAGRFLFRGDEVFRRVETFSGGEQGRLALALLVMGKHNTLLLDEPTNHLDIPSREVLEEALLLFPGTVVVVSHDRFFLDRIAHRILSFENRALVSEHGTYSDLRQSGRIMAEAGPEQREPDEGKLRRRDEYERRRKSQRAKESQRRQAAELEELIHQQEKQVEQLMEQMADPARALDWEGLEQLQNKKNEVEKQHEANLALWDRLISEIPEEDEFEEQDEESSPQE